MDKIFSSLALLAALLCFVIMLSCIQPDVSISTFSPFTEDTESTPSPALTQSTQPPLLTTAGEEYIERNIIVADKNNVFSIGMPSVDTSVPVVVRQRWIPD